MSTDRFAEILNYLSAISRDVGELRQEFRQFREETNARLDRIEQRLEKVEREQRQTTRRLDRIESLALTARADADELQERVTALEGSQT
jgi:DNA repair exonuclease SbcCD ATPase subunit